MTIEGSNPYEKTYQDRLDVSHLVDDVFTGTKSLNLDKIFVEQDTFNANHRQQPILAQQASHSSANNHQLLLSQMLSPDFQYYPGGGNGA